MKGSRFILLAALLLSGCFRPAGDSIQPTSDTSGSNVSQPIGGATATPGAPAITLLSPDTSSASDATATQPVPALTEVTLAPASPTPEAATPDPFAVATLQIITPGISLGLMTPDTPIPFPTALPSPEGAAAGEGEGETSPDAQAVEATGPQSGDPCTYTVEAGDSLYLIAIQNDTTVAGLQQANPELEGDAPVLQIDQVILLSDCTPGEEPVVEAETPAAPETAPESAGTALPEGAQIYSVRPGDTMGAIASRFRVTVRAILEANGLNNPDILSIGQELIIPAPAS